MAEDYVLQTKITADSTEFQNAIKGVSDSLNGIKKSLTKATDSIKKGTANWGLDLDKFYDKGSGIFKSFGVDIDKFASHFGVSGKLVSAITVATVALTKFGQSMNGARAELAKGTGAIGEDLIKLQDTFHKAMIEGIGRDAKEVGGMMADLNTRFGATGEELVAMTAEFDKFAEVMGVDARQAINTTADIMAKWGLETEKLSPLLDQLTTASQMSGATIDELTNGLKQGQAVFSQFGMSATDSIAMLSSFAKNGLETTTAINSMRFALNTFSKAGIDAKEGLEETAEAIKTASSETEALSIASSVFGAKNGAEMVKVLKSGALSADDFKTALMNAGGALEATDKASRTSVDAFEDLKATLTGTFAGFGEGFDNLFRDLIDSIQEVVKFIAPVIEPIGNIFRDVFSAIGQMLKILVDNFIEFQKRYNTVFSAVTSVIQTVYEIIHKVLSNMVEMFGNTFSFIFAILDGKWGLAWEYAKKQALLFSKNISDILSGIVKLFAKMINGVIEKLNSAIDLYHKLPKSVQIFDIQNIDKISENIDLASEWNITGKLAETQQKIDELTGKASKKIIGALGKVKEVSTDVSGTMKSEAMEVSQISIDWSNKLLQQEIAVLEKEREDAVNRAKLEKQTEQEIFDIKKSYADKIYALQVKQIEAQREAEIKKVKASNESFESQKDLIAKINKYYDTQKSLIKDSTSFIEKSDKAIKKSSNSWDSWIKSFEDKANDWTTMTTSMAQTGTEAMGDMFTMLGENLAGAGHGYEDFAATATEALSEVLKGLAAQLSALAVTKAVAFQWGQAAIAAAGAAAALVAAGALKNTSKSIKDVGDAAEKSAGSLEEFMKKMEQIKEGTYGQEAGLLQLGQSQLSRQIEEARKKRDEWEKIYKDYMAQRDYWVREGYINKPEEYQKLADSAWAEWTKLNKAVSELKSQYASAPTETLNRLKDEVAGVQDVIYSYQSLYNSVEAYYSLSEKVNSFSKKTQETARRYNELLQKYPVSVARRIMKQEGYNLTAEAQFLAQLLNNLKKYQNSVDILKESIVKDIETLRQDVTTSLISIGKDIGEQFVSSIIDGTKSTDFMGNMKKTIRSYMIKMAIYTESFSKKMGEIGSKLIVAISDGGDKRQLTMAKEELLALYETAEKTAGKLDKTLDDVFGKTSDDVFGKTSESIDTATNSLTKFENAMKDLLDSIQDLGGDIASNLVDALSNGLTQSDFLGNMKTWLRKMMIQMVVYTDTMKAEVEEIGKRISKGLTSGFTDTSLHEIRRDLSYIFEQTSSKMANLDTILDGVFSGYATGTENARRGIHLVGEAGPELVQFKGGERVFNNRDTMSMISGGNPSNNFNVTFNNLQDTSAFAMVSQLKQYQREMAFNAVI